VAAEPILDAHGDIESEVRQHVQQKSLVIRDLLAQVTQFEQNPHDFPAWRRRKS
jgi:hypothetical protein